MTVQFARGNRAREGAFGERAPPRPRRTSHRMQISGLPPDTSWQVCLLPSPKFLVPLLPLVWIAARPDIASSALLCHVCPLPLLGSCPLRE